MTAPVPSTQTRRQVTPESLGIVTSAELAAPSGIIGHARAIEALRLGLSIRSDGYHVFAMGHRSTGIESMVHYTVKQIAEQRPAGPDTILLHDFDKPRHPLPVRLPAGDGPRFASAVDEALKRVAITVPAAFQHDAYQIAQRSIMGREQTRSAALFKEFQGHARTMGVSVQRKDDILVVAPLIDGEPADSEAFEALPDEQKEPLAAALQQIQQNMAAMAAQERSRMEEMTEVKRTLDRRTAASGTRPAFDRLRDEWPQPAIQRWISMAESAMVSAGPDLFEEDEPTPWTVNVLVTNDPKAGAPVIAEDDPSWPALAGRVEHEPIKGALSTNHSLVQPGALHRAHGGFLIIEARRLVSHPGAWIGLKRALRQRLIRTEAPMAEPGVAAAVTLEPAPMPLQVDVVLVGSQSEYRTLTSKDPDFSLLFGVAAEFEPDMPWTQENVMLLARRLADMGRRDELLPLTAAALAALIEHAGRLASDQKRLSLAMEPLRRVHREAHFVAGQDGSDAVTEVHIAQAIAAQRRREGGAAERNMRGYLDGSVRVATEGASIGEVNGLAVLSTGRMRFGMASRISARVWPGDGKILNIEREAGLSGAFHSKGILVLTGLLGGRYAPRVPLCLTASLVFEQSYSPVDGDSASMAELIALLSALSGVPILQGRAITGSVDQNGNAQAIGGVNDKIEGFYDLCTARTLTGEQGVVIPASNVLDLMLRDDVVQSIEAGVFHIWAMNDVDDAFEVLTGLPAGRPDDNRAFPSGSPNAKVAASLAAFAETARKYGSA